MRANKPVTIYTIGHSNHSIDEFLAILRRHDVQTVADVRSTPFSRRNPQFNQESLNTSLQKSRIEYVYMGKELGGHPESSDLYDQHGHVIYERVAKSSEFRRGMRRAAELADTTKLALMCAEGDPAKCHRHPLLARFLLERAVRVLHIRRDGVIEDAEPMLGQPPNSQLPLFEPPGEDLTWRSPKRIR